MANKRSDVTPIVHNKSQLAYYFHNAMHCLHLSASVAIKVSAMQNAKNVQKVVKILLSLAKYCLNPRLVMSKRNLLIACLR